MGKSNRNHCYITKRKREEPAPVVKFKIIMMTIIFVGMIISYAFELLPTEITALMAGLLCIIFRLCTEKQIFNGMAWTPLIMLGGTIGIAAGLNASGAGEILASWLPEW